MSEHPTSVMPMPARPEEPPSTSSDPQSKKRKRSRRDETGERRCTNACRRCKRMKLKCSYLQVGGQIRCVACCNSKAECQIDEPAVRSIGSAIESEHVSTLESRIKTLEQELFRTKPDSHMLLENPQQTTAQNEGPFLASLEGVDPPQATQSAPIGSGHCEPSITQSVICMNRAANSRYSQPQKFPVLEPENGTSPPILIYGGQVHVAAGVSIDLPDVELGERLVETAYSYVQARYCIVDWVQVRQWHLQRDMFLESTQESDISSQTGAFFIWMIYAIGSQLVPDANQQNTEAYFNRASNYLPTIMGLQDMSTVQALLCMIQYCFRAPKGPSLWDLTRMVTSLCIKLRYHRSINCLKHRDAIDPFTIELRKRFWWCAFCFDRCVSMLAKLPFSIRDIDIDVDEPVNVDDACIDQDKIREMQQRQASDNDDLPAASTTMSSALQHLRVYRIRSAVTTRFAGPNAEVPSYDDVQSFLTQLNDWRQRFPKRGEQAWSPQQPPDRVQATYLQAILVLIRPVLLQEFIEPPLLSLCASFAADACESGRTLSLDPQTFPDRITMFHCFFCGITLLQCLTIDPKALSRRQTHQATGACLSSLAVYSRALPAVKPFLHLYDELLNRFFGNDDDETQVANPELRVLLNQVVSSDPSETPEYKLLRSLRPQVSEVECQQEHMDEAVPQANTTGQNTTTRSSPQSQGMLGEGNFSQIPMYDLDLPDLDSLLFDVTNPDVSSIWSSSWLDNFSTT